MTEERISPLRARMIEDMRIRGMGENVVGMVVPPIHHARHVFSIMPTAEHTKSAARRFDYREPSLPRRRMTASSPNSSLGRTSTRE